MKQMWRDLWFVLKAHPYLIVGPICLVLWWTGDLRRIVNSTLERRDMEMMCCDACHAITVILTRSIDNTFWCSICQRWQPCLPPKEPTK